MSKLEGFCAEIEPLFGFYSLDKLQVNVSVKQNKVPVFHRDSILFSKLFICKKPVMLKGFMNNEWKKWNPDSLRLIFGAEVLTVLVSRDNHNFIDNDLMCEKISIEGTEFFDYVFKRPSNELSRRFYFRSVLPKEILSSIDQSPLQELLNRSPADRDNTSLIRLWIGTAGNITPLHYDRCHGILSQIYGRKKITLISPKHTQDIYPYDTHTSRAHCSRVDLIRWDDGDDEQRRKYPRFSHVKRIECILESGDILYTPPGWWHHVQSLTASVSITVPFDLKPEEPIPPNMII